MAEAGDFLEAFSDEEREALAPLRFAAGGSSKAPGTSNTSASVSPASANARWAPSTNRSASSV